MTIKQNQVFAAVVITFHDFAYNIGFKKQ